MGPRLNRRNAQIIRAQFTLELVLSAFALAAAFVVLRLVFRLLSISDGVWSGGLVYAVSDWLIWPLTLLPGSGRVIWGAATLADFTAPVIAMLLPLLFTLRGRTQRV